MKQSLKNLIGHSIETNDGMEGKIKDFLFDEDNWAVRYLEADFGGFFNDKRVILPIDVIMHPNWENNQIQLNISKEKIERSPAPEDILTISREYEQKLYEYYGYPMYWGTGYVPPMPSDAFFPARPLNVPKKNKQLSEKSMDSSLRNFNDVEGYNIRAIDDTLGHVEDLIVDDADWQLVYVIVDTSNWPWSKKVMLAIDWMEEISFVNREVKINLNTETIKDAPDYDSDQPIEMSYEHELSEYYHRNRLM